MYAIFRTGSKQYRAEKGATIQLDRQAPKDGEKIEFTDVTRPSRCAGVSTCSSVDRISTLTLSAIPLITRTATDK